MFGISAKQNIVGLDVGSNAVKIVELEKKRGGLHLASFGAVGLPEDSIVDGEVLNHTSVVDSIKTLANELNIAASPVCTSVCGSSLIVKHISIPKVPLRELDDQIYWEAEQYIPFDMAEINMDYEIVNADGDHGQIELILVAAKKDFIEKRLTTIRDAGFDPQILDVDAFALANIYWENYDVSENTFSVLIDLGAAMTKINIVTQETTLFMRDIAVGGKNLTQEIQDKLGVSFEEAEILKIDAATSEQIPKEVLEAINTVSENIGLELRRSLDFFIASNADYPITGAYVCGGACKMPGLTSALEDMLGLPVYYLNPFERIGYNSQVYNDEFIAAIASSAAVPMGLAMRNFE